MKEFFLTSHQPIDDSFETCTFLDDGIEYNYNNTRGYFIPYGDLESIKFGFLGSSVKVVSKSNINFSFVVLNNEKARFNKAMGFAMEAKKTAVPQKSRDITEEIVSRANEVEEKTKDVDFSALLEHRMRCNVCNKVFCYTDADVSESQAHAKWAVAHAVGSMANAAFGSAYLMNEESKKADMETSKIRDFSKCPYCNSSSLVEITMEEWEKSLNEKKPSNNPVGGSVADEIKKFKELLDIGAITQEEFDAKKKQLLGL